MVEADHDHVGLTDTLASRRYFRKFETITGHLTRVAGVMRAEGVLSREEFAAGQGMRGHGKGKDDMDGSRRGQMRDHAGKMKERADTNGDGSVSKAEFDAAHMAMFDKADANGDGTVTNEERRAAFKEMRAKGRDRTGNDNAK